MNHAVVTEHLADYLEGDLALDLRALVDAHLDGCTTCAQEVREMQQTIRLLRALPEPEPPPMIAANVMRRIRAGETQPTLRERIQRVVGGVLEPSFVLPASAMAIAALVIFAIQDRTPVSGSIEPNEAREASAADERFAAGAPSEADPSETEAIDRSFGASAARELAAAPAPARSLPMQENAPGIREEQEVFPSPSPAREAGRAEATYAAQDALASEPWEDAPREAPRGPSNQASASGSRFGDPMLAQGFAPSGPTPTAASNRVSGAFATAMPTSLSRRPADGQSGLRADDSGGEDPRDAWLARALENPVEFAHYIARHNLAEQELWVARLAERARSRGLLNEVVEALRAAGDEKTAWLADDFAAAGRTSESGATEGERERSLDDRGAFDR